MVMACAATWMLERSMASVRCFASGRRPLMDSNHRPTAEKAEKFTVVDWVFEAMTELLDVEGALGIPKKCQ